MRIESYGLGFSSNSSSSNFIVRMKHPELEKDLNASYSDIFSRSPCVVVTTAAKMRLLTKQLINFLTEYRDMSNADAIVYAKGILGKDYVKHTGRDYGVDHQSSWFFPGTLDTPELPNMAFIRALTEYLKNPEVGFGFYHNDEIDAPHIMGDRLASPIIEEPSPPSRWIVRDDGNKRWFFYNLYDGHKMTVSLDLKNEFPHRRQPELAEIKVTNACPKQCQWCYQNSTPDGTHASDQAVNNVIYHLTKRNIPEIVLGGGEPLLWPHIIPLLTGNRGLKKWSGILPHSRINLTTALVPNTDENKRLISLALLYCGAVGFSYHNPSDLRCLSSFLDSFGRGFKSNTRLANIAIHMISGITSMSVVDAYENMEHVNYKHDDEDRRYGFFMYPLILGYKNIGRGGDFTPNSFDPGAYLLSKTKHRHMAVDTVYMQSHPELEKRIDKRCVVPGEGINNLYVDAVDGWVGPSSFCDPSQRVSQTKWELRRGFDYGFIDAYINEHFKQG